VKNKTELVYILVWTQIQWSWRTAANFSSLPPCSPPFYVMADKDKGKEGKLRTIFRVNVAKKSSDSTGSPSSG